jgi:hypothetical protein
MTRHTAFIFASVAFLFAAGFTLSACDKKQEDESTAESVSADQKPGTDEKKGEEEHDDHDEHAEEEHGHHDVHLGNKMYELQRRWAAIWFAGKAGDAEMVKYQTHEIEEIVAVLDEHDPQEAGVDVVDRVNVHVTDRLEGIEEAAEANDQELFEKRYNVVTAGCNGCHAETKHAFIRVKKPEYNPYPNLQFGSD